MKVPENLVVALQQPHGVEIKLVDGMFLKQMIIPLAGTYVPQHSHEHDHVSGIMKGRVQVWADDERGERVDLGEHGAGSLLTIKAWTKHTMLALEDETIVWCLHNISRTGEVDIHDEHHLVEIRES
jgi:mannose-6-phosphate isomerase-like protein (cupin superfamily)